MSTNISNLLYKIGLAKNNTPILLSINNKIDYYEYLNQLLKGIFEESPVDYQNYLSSVNSLIVDANAFYKGDLEKIFEHINTAPLQNHLYKICVIENIDGLSPIIANALLKTIEEPSPFTFLILITNNIANVLDTIKSRCNVLNLCNQESIHNQTQSLKINGLNEKEQDALSNVFQNINSFKSWYNQDNAKVIIDFFKVLIDHQNDYCYLYKEASVFANFEYKQIKILIQWLINYFDKKDASIFQLWIENYDLNLSKNYLYYCLLLFLNPN